LEGEICRADAKAIAKELDAGQQSAVELRPCLNEVVPQDPRYKSYVTALEAAKAKGDQEGALNAYSDFYRDVLGPAQTEFWRSVNKELNPKGLCHLELIPSKEFPGIADHVKITCEADESTPTS